MGSLFPTTKPAEALLFYSGADKVTHILQGFPRHPESGVMKAHWDSQDFAQMTWKPLHFTEEDVDLIQRGLDTRKADLASATLVAGKLARVIAVNVVGIF